MSGIAPARNPLRIQSSLETLKGSHFRHGEPQLALHHVEIPVCVQQFEAVYETVRADNHVDGFAGCNTNSG